ncbi:MAG: hypothetical protein AB7W59_04855 [Acidimicrobiia bacterium]
MPNTSARARLLLQEILHPEEMNRFIAGCVPTSVEELRGLRERSDDYLQWAKDQAAQSAAVDLDTAERIAGVLASLLDEPDRYDDEARALLAGATSYFVDADDGSNDLTDVLGFDDDARVLNAVLDAIGRRDLRIELS